MDWNIIKNSGTCGKCERPIQEEETIYSCLSLNDNAFLRLDFCDNCWGNESESRYFSFWKTHVPKKSDQKRKVIDNAAIMNLFLRLGENERYQNELWAKNMRYVLALFLMRKKLLKPQNQGKDDVGDFMELYSNEEDKLFKIYNPRLDEEEVTRLNDEILKLFDPSLAGQSTLLELTQDPASI